MHRKIRIWAFCAAAFFALLPTATSANSQPGVTVLMTHPSASMLHHYVTMSRKHVLNIPGLRIVAVYHEAEMDNYRAASAYIAKEHISWITLHTSHCALSADDVYRNNACRDEFQRLFRSAQGIVFNGGWDIPPALYNEPTSLASRVDTPKRSIFEVSFLVNLLGSPRAPDVAPMLDQRPKFPILGICMGMQSLNVADGGTLIQDIPSQIYDIRTVEQGLRSNPETWHGSYLHDDPALAGMAPGVMHPVRVSPNAPAALKAPSDAFPQVLSIHHQAVGQVGADYVVYATSVDGKVIEAIGNKHYTNVLGVQWHPERAPLWDPQAVESQNPYDVSTNGPNIAYSTLAHDPVSRAFIAEVWTWFANAVQHVGAAHT